MTFKLGPISTGTLRGKDLLKAYTQTLTAHQPDHPLLAELDKWSDHSMQDLHDALNTLCPPFVYFGAHPGDGADFGFWHDWDALGEVMGKCPGCKQHWLPQHGVIISPNDFSNAQVTVMDLDRNVIWSTV